MLYNLTYFSLDYKIFLTKIKKILGDQKTKVH